MKIFKVIGEEFIGCQEIYIEAKDDRDAKLKSYQYFLDKDIDVENIDVEEIKIVKVHKHKKK